MEKNIFLIQWYGPFESVDALKNWEINRKERFVLYLFQGKKNRKNKTYKYYCGETYDRKESVACVYVRMNDKDHHIHEFENGEIKIWVGTIANKRKPTQKEVFLCEKMITSELSQIELDDKKIVNGTNKKPPKQNVYVINEWYGKNNFEYRPMDSNTIPRIVPDVMTYYAPEQIYYRSKQLVRVN